MVVDAYAVTALVSPLREGAGGGVSARAAVAAAAGAPRATRLGVCEAHGT
jgi:hypothetical protein